jgi:hypothetical protein
MLHVDLPNRLTGQGHVKARLHQRRVYIFTSNVFQVHNAIPPNSKSVPLINSTRWTPCAIRGKIVAQPIAEINIADAYMGLVRNISLGVRV